MEKIISGEIGERVEGEEMERSEGSGKEIRRNG